jgi:hypothetical protein
MALVFLRILLELEQQTQAVAVAVVLMPLPLELLQVEMAVLESLLFVILILMPPQHLTQVRQLLLLQADIVFTNGLVPAQ